MRELSAQRTYTRSRTPIFIYLTVQFIYLTLCYIYLTVLSYVAIVIWTSLAVQALHITRFDNKPRDVVSPPTVGGGTTYEVSLRKEKKKPRMWSHHQQSVVVPHTKFDNKPRHVVPPPTVGAETTSRVFYLLLKWTSYVVPPPTVGGETTSRGFFCFVSEPRMWYHHRLSVVRPHCEVFFVS
jgi:hypothetical protein